MKHVVTGGAGFIGTHVVRLLQEEGHEVVVIDKRTAPSWLPPLDIGDPSVAPRLLKIIEGADVVYHLAAQTSVPGSLGEPVSFNSANVSGTLNILEASRQAGVRRLVFSSSSSVYGNIETFPTHETTSLNPLSPYALQKQAGELYCRLYSDIYGLETVCLRYFNVYGEGMPTSGTYCNVIGAFSALKKEGTPLKIFGDGSQKRDFTYVKDIALANLLASSSPKVGKGECINIGTGTNYSVQEIADIFGGSFEYLPKRLEPSQSLADNTKAKELLGWLPTTNVKDWLNENIHSGT